MGGSSYAPPSPAVNVVRAMPRDQVGTRPGSRGVRESRSQARGVPQRALGDDHDDRPDEGDEHRREYPPARGDAQGREDPAPHDAPDQPENHVSDQPVSPTFDHEFGQPAGEHSYNRARYEHSEIHERASFSRRAGASASASPSRSRLTGYTYH